MHKENLILVVIGFADTVALNLYMSQSIYQPECPISEQEIVDFVGNSAKFADFTQIFKWPIICVGHLIEMLIKEGFRFNNDFAPFPKRESVTA